MVTQTTLPSPPRGAPAPPDGPEYDDGIYYPSSDGKPMADNTYQAKVMTYVYDALTDWFDEDDDIYVVMNLLIYYARGDNSSSVAPDVGVMFGADGKHDRYSWMAWRENGVLPDVAMEFASRSTWRADQAKRDLYARLGVGEYWRHDPSISYPVPVLAGERLVNGRYEPIEVFTDDSGILRGYSEALGLELCVRMDLDPKLRLYDPRAGEWLLSPSETRDALAVSEQARRRAEEEARRLRELLARIRGES